MQRSVNGLNKFVEGTIQISLVEISLFYLFIFFFFFYFILFILFILFIYLFISDGHFVKRSKIVGLNLVEDHIRNYPLNFD